MMDLIAAIILLCLWLLFRQPENRYLNRGRRAAADEAPRFYRTHRKPDWVPQEIIRLKAMRPEWSCRYISQVFNRMYAARRNMTVGKTYVSEAIKCHAYEIADVRRRVRQRKGRPGPRNRTWGIDLTGKAVIGGWQYPIFGVIDHGTRFNLHLDALPNKRSLTLLLALGKTCFKYGRPKTVRTDNEAVFTSRLFRLGLKLLRIKHEITDLHCPWQNGRIERFFGTLKQKLDCWKVPNRDALNVSLVEFRFWYNQVRPHQSLYGRTPAEVWNGKDIYRRRPKAMLPYEAWDGLLSGIYLPT